MFSVCLTDRRTGKSYTHEFDRHTDNHTSVIVSVSDRHAEGSHKCDFLFLTYIPSVDGISQVGSITCACRSVVEPQVIHISVEAAIRIDLLKHPQRLASAGTTAGWGLSSSWRLFVVRVGRRILPRGRCPRIRQTGPTRKFVYSAGANIQDYLRRIRAPRAARLILEP